MSPVPNHENGRNSSLIEKLPVDFRARLDRAILDRRPASLARCHRAFQLAAHGVSLPAFYRYARKLRDRIDLDDAFARFSPDDPDVSGILPQFLGRKLLAMLLDEVDVNPATLHRLTLAYRAAHNVQLELQKAKSTSAATAAMLAKTVKDADNVLATIRHEVAKADYSYFEDLYPDSTPTELANLKSTPPLADVSSPVAAPGKQPSDPALPIARSSDDILPTPYTIHPSISEFTQSQTSDFISTPPIESGKHLRHHARQKPQSFMGDPNENAKTPIEGSALLKHLEPT